MRRSSSIRQIISVWSSTMARNRRSLSSSAFRADLARFTLSRKVEEMRRHLRRIGRETCPAAMADPFSAVSGGGTRCYLSRVASPGFRHVDIAHAMHGLDRLRPFRVLLDLAVQAGDPDVDAEVEW